MRTWPMLLLCACAPADPPAGDDTDVRADDPGPPPDWQPPDVPGPYAVGTTTRTVARDERPDLVLEIWYPAVPASDDTPDPYQLDGLTFDGGAFRDAPVDVRGAPYPLATFSHGLGGIRFQSVFLTEHLASHGWVVVAPDHAGSTMLDLVSDEIPVVAARRPADVSEAADAVFEGIVAGLAVVPDRYAAVGHSFGAWTSLVVGGGVLDPEGAVQACEADRRPGCGFFEGRAMPEDDVLRWGQPDPRAEVVAALAPGVFYTFGTDGEGLADVTRTLVLGGTRDGDMPYDKEIKPTFDRLGGPATLGALADSGHWAFTDLCAILPLEDCAGPSAGYMAPDRAQAITTSRVTAFLGRHLQQDERYEEWLVGDTDLAWTDVP